MTREERAGLKDWATIFSLIALPLILAVGSWVIQDRIATQGAQKDYVQLAIEILRQRELKDEATQRKGFAAGCPEAAGSVEHGQPPLTT